jgi:hypothetical protein
MQDSSVLKPEQAQAREQQGLKASERMLLHSLLVVKIKSVGNRSGSQKILARLSISCVR